MLVCRDVAMVMGMINSLGLRQCVELGMWHWACGDMELYAGFGGWAFMYIRHMGDEDVEKTELCMIW